MSAAADGLWVGPEQPTDDTVRAVLDLARAARAADGVGPLSEQSLLRLRHGSAAATHGIARTRENGHENGPGNGSDNASESGIVGYLQLVPDDGATVAELVVAPRHRRRGVGTALGAWAIERLGPARPLRAWAHGDGPAAAGLAAALDFERGRMLLQMRRQVGEPLPPVQVPPGVTIRTFRPGADDEAWVRVNARAFASHPEQGRLVLADLHERLSEPWFDAAGFFVAERAGPARLVGFHWTKVHDEPEPIGEVYVVGLDPDEQGTGLGLALTVTGLAHLAAAGLPAVMLYADETNAGAVRMYERLGFVRTSVDVTYER